MPKAKPGQGHRAFTLIELVVVLMILGIVAGVAAPRYADAIAQTHVDAAAHRVAADIRYARSEARRTSRATTITFADATDSYALTGVANLDRSTRAYQVDLSGEPYEVQMDSVDFGGGASLSFDAYGAPDAVGYVRLQRGGHRIAITCNALGDTAYEAW